MNARTMLKKNSSTFFIILVSYRYIRCKLVFGGEKQQQKEAKKKHYSHITLWLYRGRACIRILNEYTVYGYQTHTIKWHLHLLHWCNARNFQRLLIERKLFSNLFIHDWKLRNSTILSVHRLMICQLYSSKHSIHLQQQQQKCEIDEWYRIRWKKKV